MDKQALAQLLADPTMERLALAIIRQQRTQRAANSRGEVSYAEACRIYDVTYAVLRSIKCLKRMGGSRGHINAKELAEYMRGYKPWRPERKQS